MAREGVSSRPDAWAHPGGHDGIGGKCAAEPLGPQVSLGQGWAACGRITQDRQMQREALRKGDCSDLYFETRYLARADTVLPAPAAGVMEK